MTESPIVHADIGDGKERRFFLGADELRQLKRECGRGFYTLYTRFSADAEPDEVKAILRLALIGGGEAPNIASELSGYYAAPPRPLKEAYLLAYRCLHAAWAGAENEREGKEADPTLGEIDQFFDSVTAAFLKNGMDLSIMKNRSFAEIQAIMKILRKGAKGPDAPSDEAFNAIKALHKGSNK